MIGNGVAEIGQSAIRSCASLESLTIPSSVIKIGANAFYHGDSLKGITVLRDEPPQTAENAFNQTNNCPIYVPADSVTAYKTASGWSSYASRITAIST